jgi:hypothetical protein
VYRRIDELLAAQQPGENHISRLRNKIPNNTNTFRYFFDRAKTKEWVAAITKDNSLFTDPPDGGPWPAIQYLVQIAPEYPTEVHRVLTQLATTPNTFTHMAIVQIADAFPPELAKDIVAREAAAFSDGTIKEDFVARDLAKAAARVSGIDLDTALRCFGSLLALQPGQPRDVVSALDTYSYEEVIKALRPLMRRAPQPTYHLLAGVLDAALQSTYGETGDDISNGWMPAIEPHQQNRFYQPLPHLATAVRDAAEHLLEASPTALPDIIADAQGRRWSFFRRLALHLLRLQPDSPAAHVRALQTDIVQEWELKHEARLFLRAVFPHLGQGEREQVVGEMLAGPNDVGKGSFANDDERDDYRERWVTRRLWWVHEWLSGERRQRYEALLTKHGEPDEKSDFVGWIGPLWVGPTSPKKAAELQDMPVPAIIEFLQHWQPSGNVFGQASSREGMARELQTVAAKRPSDFSEAAPDLIGLDATYLRGILNGLQNAVQNDRTLIAWDRVLDLCRWMVSQERTIPGRIEDGWDNDDPHWGWARGAVARLIETELRGARRIDIALRQQVWDILAVIAEDPDPSPQREQESNSEPLNIAINSTRGEAFQAVMEYARWVRLSVPEDKRATDFGDMPEVPTLLEAHLARDHSVGVRAVYGQYLALICSLDRNWLERHLGQLFSDEQPNLREAIWQTHIVYGRTNDTLMALLASEYTHALARLAEKPLYSDYRDQLTRHILWLYTEGKVSSNDGDLLDRFLQAADAETRARAVELVPGAVGDIVEDDDDARYRRTLEAFWTWCAAREDLTPAQAGFGVWFLDEKLALEWRLIQLERALQSAGDILRETRVMDVLAESATAQPVRVLRNARLLVDTSDPMWIHLWAVDGKLRQIITAAIQSGDAATTDAARALANHLVGRGFDSFLDLAAPAATTE